MRKFTVYGELACFFSTKKDSIFVRKSLYMVNYGFNRDRKTYSRERRKELGLDQATLATLAGIGINALVRLERGSGNPRFDVLLMS